MTSGVRRPDDCTHGVTCPISLGLQALSVLTNLAFAPVIGTVACVPLTAQAARSGGNSRSNVQSFGRAVQVSDGANHLSAGAQTAARPNPPALAP